MVTEKRGLYFTSDANFFLIHGFAIQNKDDDL